MSTTRIQKYQFERKTIARAEEDGRVPCGGSGDVGRPRLSAAVRDSMGKQKQRFKPMWSGRRFFVLRCTMILLASESEMSVWAYEDG